MYEANTGENRWYNTSDSTAHWTATDLHSYYIYHIQVAAVTVGLGPFTKPVEIQMPEEGSYIEDQAGIIAISHFSFSLPQLHLVLQQA